MYLLDTRLTDNFKKEQIKVPVTNGNTVKILATKLVNLVSNTIHALKMKLNVEKDQQE